MKVNIENLENEILISIEGRLDTVNAVEFEQNIASIKETSMEKIVLDCAQLSYICSSGLRVFLTLQKKSAEKKGNLIIRNMNETIKEIFDMTGFTNLFNFE